LAMGARTRLFTSLASGSGKATAVVVCAVMLLAGCGGSGGSATDAGAPVIRGDVAAASSVSATPSVTVERPGQPPVPTGAAGDGKVTVTVAQGSSGGTPATYTVTAVGTSKTCTVTGATGSCDVTGLTNATPYTFTAIATNEGGISGASAPSNSVTPVAAATTATVRTVTFRYWNGQAWEGYRQTGSSPTALIPNKFTRSGGSFVGWNTYQYGWEERTGEGFADGAVYPFASDIVLYAQWARAGAPYNIVPKVEGPGSVSLTFLTVPNSDGTPAAISDYELSISKNGGRVATRTVSGPGTYTFNDVPAGYLQFYISKGSSIYGSTPNGVDVPTGPTVTFNANGGSWYMTNQMAGGETRLKANEFTKSGYVFDGWATTSNGDKAYANGALYPFTSDATLYALWVLDPSTTSTYNAGLGPGEPYNIQPKVLGPGSVSLRFLANRNSDGTPAAIIDYELQISKNGGRVATRTVSGPGTYTFNGLPSGYLQFYVKYSWKILGSTPVGVDVSAPGTPPAPTVVAGTAKVTATVAAGTSGGTPATYTVKAYAVDGTVAGTCTVTGASGSCDVTALTGGSTYTVKAIAINAAGDSGESGASSPVTVAAPLRTVTFNANGGENTMGDQTANKSTPLKENVFKRSGYVFDGWSTTVNGDKAYGDGDNYKFGENATLYARWAAVPSTVTTPAATVPGAPALTALSRRSKTEVWVTFSAPSSNGGEPITGYTVTAKSNGVDVTQSLPAEAGRVSVGPLTRYAVYTFTVRAVNSVGTSGPSNASRFTVG